MMARTRLTLNLSKDTARELGALSESLGYPEEIAAEYAIRLVCACARERLLDDIPIGAWPQEARVFTGTHGKVIAMDAARHKRRKGMR